MSKEKEKTEQALAREEARKAKEAEKKAREDAKAAKAAEREAKKAAKAAERDARKAGEPAGADGKPKKKSKAVKAVALILGIVLVLTAIMTGTVAYAGYKLAKSDKIFPGVCVGEIPVGRLTQTEAIAALEVKGWDKSVGGTLNVTLPMDVGCQLDYLESGASLNAEKAAQAAFRFGREGSVLQNLRTYLYSLRHTTDVSEGDYALDEAYIRQRLQDAVTLFHEAAAGQGLKLNEEDSTITLLKGAGQMKVDEEELYGLVVAALEAREEELRYDPKIGTVRAPDFEAMHAELFTEPVNAHYDPETDTIEPDVKGVDFDVEEAAALWEAAEVGKEVVIPVTITEPVVTEQSMHEMLFRDLLGECTTSFWGSTDNRINNIEIVANKLNGFVLQPGETFSYNGYVGERTAAAGFKSADAYVNGSVRPELGGGICQVSSTLYNAILCAQLEVTERSCHMFRVGYLRAGLDATVSWPSPDLKFVNTRDYPVRFVATVDRENTNLTIQVWGSNVDGTYAVPGSSFWKKYDAEWLEKGYEVHVGWWANSWLDIYDADGNLLETRQGYRSYYDLHAEDIQWPEIPDPTPTPSGGGGGGDGEINIEPDPTPEPPPDPTPEPPPDPTPEPTPVIVEPDPTPEGGGEGGE